MGTETIPITEEECFWHSAVDPYIECPECGQHNPIEHLIKSGVCKGGPRDDVDCQVTFELEATVETDE